MSHDNGRGYVASAPGDYRDARIKGNTVIPLIIEIFGGVTAHGRRAIRHLAKRAETKGNDGTIYGTSRTSTRDFYTHHLRRLALKAMVGNAKAVRRAIQSRKVALAASGALARGSI